MDQEHYAEDEAEITIYEQDDKMQQNDLYIDEFECTDNENDDNETEFIFNTVLPARQDKEQKKKSLVVVEREVEGEEEEEGEGDGQGDGAGVARTSQKSRVLRSQRQQEQVVDHENSVSILARDSVPGDMQLLEDVFLPI